MVPSLRVCFPSTQVRAGEIGMSQLGRAYLLALAAAQGLPPPGLAALSASAALCGARREGGRIVWTFRVSQRCHEGGAAPLLVGESRLHGSFQSYAELSASGGDPGRAQAALEAFQRALSPHDVLNTPDGAAVQAIEAALTDLCGPGGGPIPAAAHEEALGRALAGRGALGAKEGRPELAAALFLLACLRLLRGDEAGAGPLLGRLRAVGPGLRFSHGVAGRFSAQGRLLGIEWRERLEPPAPFGQVGRALREV
jgi:hypothetical protein